MGEGNSKPELPEIRAFVNQFRNEYTMKQEGYDDPRLGRVNIYKHQSEANYIAVKKSYSHNQGLVENCQQRLNQAVLTFSQCPYLLKVMGYDHKDDDSMCGSVSEMQTYHEYYLNNLEAEIQQRLTPGVNQFGQQEQSLFYSETELWVILYSAIASVNFLSQHNRTINDIRPQNIYITPNGQLKFVPFEMFPEDIPAFLKVQHYNDQCYIPPEQLAEIREKSLRSNQDQVKADGFAIGLTLLQCSTLISSVDCYDWDTYTFLPQVVEERLNLMRQQGYSKFFVNVIKLLLDMSPETRPTPQKIAQVLEPYEHQILNLIPFQPNYDQIRAHLTVPQASPERNPAVQSQVVPQQQTIVQQQPQQQQQLLQQQPLSDSGVFLQPVVQPQQQQVVQELPQQTSQVFQQQPQQVVQQVVEPQQVQQQLLQQASPQAQSVVIQPQQAQQQVLQQQAQQQVVQQPQQQEATTTNVQQANRALKFDELPPEVQEQIKSGQTGPLKAAPTQTSTLTQDFQNMQLDSVQQVQSVIQPQVIRQEVQQQQFQQEVQVAQQQPEVYQQQQQLPYQPQVQVQQQETQQVVYEQVKHGVAPQLSSQRNSIPSQYQGFQQVSQPPKEIVEQTQQQFAPIQQVQQQAYEPQSPIRLVQGPLYGEQQQQQQTVYETQYIPAQQPQQQIVQQQQPQQDEIQQQQPVYQQPIIRQQETQQQIYQHQQVQQQQSEQEFRRYVPGQTTLSTNTYVPPQVQPQQQQTTTSNHVQQFVSQQQQQYEPTTTTVQVKPEQQTTTTTYQQQYVQQQQVPQQQQEVSYAQGNGGEMSDIDRRYNEIINKSKLTLEKADQQSRI